jgi:hypothetical protein
VSAVADFVRETICKLTDDAAALPFACPDFACPPDTTIFGLANLQVPTATGKSRSFNGFVPATVTQIPAAGSPLPHGRATFVNVTAANAAGSTRSCRWKVTVPPQEVLGGAAVRLSYSPKGKSVGSRHAVVMNSRAPGVVQRLGAYVRIGSLEGDTGEPDGAVQGRLRSGPNATTPYLALAGADANDPGKYMALTRPISFHSRSNLRFLVEAKDIPRPGVVIYLAYGQQA